MMMMIIEDLSYFRDEYKKLVGSKIRGVSFVQLLAWKDIKDIIEEKVLSLEDLNNIWRKVIGSYNENNRAYFLFYCVIFRLGRTSTRC